jgi:hypothetical protein
MILTMRSLVVAVAAVGVVALAACGTEFVSRGFDEEGDSAVGVESIAPAFASAAMPAPALAAPPRPAPAPTAPAPPAAPAPAAIRGTDAGFPGSTTITEEAVASLVTQQRIIVRTVQMDLEVSDVPAMLQDTAKLAEELKGWVVSSSRRQKNRGAISIRVPASSLDDALERLRGLAVDVNSEVSTSRDVTDEYVDTTARLGNLEATEEALLKLMERAETVEEALEVQRTLTDIQGQIESLQGRVKFLEETSAFSLINVSLSLEPAEMFVDPGPEQAVGVGESVRFRAFFKPPEDIEDFFFTWDFGDGSGMLESSRTAPTEDEDTRVTATVTHRYSDDRDSPFIAEIKITGTGDAGLAEGEKTLTVTVTKVPVIEVFAGERVTVEEDQELELTGSFTRPEGVTEAKFEWAFGDGSPVKTGTLGLGATNVVVKHVYADHRPFAYNAILTITGQSAAGEVEAASSVSVRVTEAEGWVIAGFSPAGAGKTAVRALSGVGQWLLIAVIFVAIFSPVWGIVVVAVLLGRRRIRRRKQNATAAP